jgi:hypothetical protein
VCNVGGEAAAAAVAAVVECVGWMAPERGLDSDRCVLGFTEIQDREFDPIPNPWLLHNRRTETEQSGRIDKATDTR